MTNGNCSSGTVRSDFIAFVGERGLPLVDGLSPIAQIKPDTRSLVSMFGGAIEGIIQYEPRRSLVFNHQGLHFQSLGADGVLWTSKRISWDGFGEIVVRGSVVSGQAWDALHDTWRAFRLDLETGEVMGGAFPEILQN